MVGAVVVAEFLRDLFEQRPDDGTVQVGEGAAEDDRGEAGDLQAG
jgi:hypothetical protein